MKLSEIKKAKETLYEVAVASLGLCYCDDNLISDESKSINRNTHKLYDMLSKEENAIEYEQRKAGE